ncbi:hypothetical protein FOC4_g10004952 [Fusarium odoratissimum]|uniref:Fungal N-terminal domain-containing protein n=1 Tax=Fusarium oxysporum f. sp. cubense (strain race 4) TaxID=2502994 RepID=N1S2S8_FUSC4|nr:hypothetical protein FOC4_g10004952 [Fusarium odoratissimum]
MAEAFGIAGSAFGTVSLGLQLFKEISQYLDDIDGREEDLKQARNFATNIQVSINALDVAISNAPTDDPTTNSAIGSCRDSCVSAVNNLLALVKELRGPIISIPNSNAARAKGLCAKLKYPFKKQSIEKLEENLSRTNSALQTMLQVFQLNTGRTTTSAIKSMHQTVADVNVILDKNETTLDEMHKTSQLHDNRLSAIQRDVRDLLILTRDSDDSKLLLRPMAEQMSDLTSHTSVAPKLLQDPASDTFTPSIQTTSYQGGGSMTFDAFCSCKTQRIRYSQRQWGPFLLEAEVRSRDHHAPECPMSKLPASTCRTKRVLSLLTPSSQRLWGRAGRVSLSFTTGAGILGIGQTVAWIATVDERVSPVFRLADTIASYQATSSWFYKCTRPDEVATTILSKYREPLGHHPHDWGLSWWRDKDHVGDGYRLFQAFPQVVENCEGCKVLEMLLRLDTPLLLTSLRVSLRSLEYGSHSCIHGRKTIIRGLVERREDLKELSYRKLSPDEREGLEIHQTRILDRNAAQVQHQLEAQGCPMPTRLSVYTEDIGSSYYHESVYSIITNGEVAEYAHQLGFYYSDNEFADFICILVKSSSYFRWINPFSSSYLCWMIDHGTSISSRIPVRQPPSPEIEATAAHYFMASLGISHWGQISDCQWIYAAIIRYYTFVTLGLRHVCCSIIKKISGPLPEEELQEIEEEDSSLLGLFESLVTEFEDGRCHDMSLEEFFEWMHMNWAPRMQEVREELASKRLTDQELRDAESIGVVWEVHGPQPMRKRPDLPRWGQGGLWNAMDQLDQIATDPERPTKESLQTQT